jgi:REP element-mobilizing transposase RayT
MTKPRHLLGAHSRGYLPHVDRAGLRYFVTFRLADALSSRPSNLDHAAAEALLDRCYGSCVLRTPAVAVIVADAMRHFDGTRYDLGPWVVMPNHVHAILRPHREFALAMIIHSWKSFTAHAINALLRRSGVLWQREYFDRFIRNERHLLIATRYIAENPVRAGLVSRPEDWPFSSAQTAVAGVCCAPAGEAGGACT